MSTQYQPYRSTRAIINTQALRHNLARVREMAPSSQVMAVIKANGYGHGLTQVAKSLASTDAFAVACVDEAIQLRKAGMKQPIVVLEGFTYPQELAAVLQNDLTCVMNNTHQVEVLCDYIEHTSSSFKDVFKIWLKLDTGMHRLGFTEAELFQVYEQLTHRDEIDPKIGIMSHFACSDEENNPYNQQQLERYQTVLNRLNPPMASMANSAAIIQIPQSHFQWVRAGIMLYGVSPFSEQTGEQLGLKPVMTLKANVVAIKHLEQGAKIGYGSSWECPEKMSVAVVAIGYGDGYPRHAGSGTPVLLNGVETQTLGRVSMDMISIDLRPLKQVKKTVRIGDEVTLWGEQLAVEKIAAHADTIGYELLCGVSARVKLEYL